MASNGSKIRGRDRTKSFQSAFKRLDNAIKGIGPFLETTASFEHVEAHTKELILSLEQAQSGNKQAAEREKLRDW